MLVIAIIIIIIIIINGGGSVWQTRPSQGGDKRSTRAGGVLRNRSANPVANPSPLRQFESYMVRTAGTVVQ